MQPEMEDKRWILLEDGSWAEMDCKWMWTDGCRMVTGDGSQELHHGRCIIINHHPSYDDMSAKQSCTLIEITHFEFKLRIYNQSKLCKNLGFQRHGSNVYDAKHYSEHCSEHYSD